MVLQSAGADPVADPEVAIRWGSFINAIINFVIVALVAFAIAKALLPKPAPGPDMKTCPACSEEILKSATRCKFCTTELTA